ncbi:LysM peptidoglycan-binding domain-containing protein [Microbacterium sp. ZOR0019]|uniref:LysM peptidoglycan-binding domain-containing protein n=1 Tax=Microbacterium sp. ZOR0019 TaxID=1339233 RepID=UPI000645C422|nr:LysM peptidoglycan-binding domain-containing protein [Microbacterium sp. ZOR0019]
MKKLFAGLGALVVMGGILIGIPVALVMLAGNPFPTAEQINAIISMRPDYGNVILFTKILPLLCWVVWAAFAGPFFVELGAAISGRPTRKKTAAFRGQQKLAATMIAAVGLMFAGSTVMAAAPAQASTSDAPAASSSAVSMDANQLGVTVASHIGQTMTAPAEAPVQQVVVHDVVEGDTLWDLAETYYGQGDRFVEIFNANLAPQADGSSLTDPDLILPGWKMTIPGVYSTAPAVEAPVAPAPTPSPDESADSVDQAPVVDDVDAGGGAGGAGGGGAGTVETRELGQSVDRPAVEVAPDAEASTEIDASIPLMTVGGIAGLLATGLLVALGTRRLRQRRRRAVGERIALPEPAAADLELEMNVVENPIAVEDVDNALRTLQAWAEDNGEQLPELLAVRVANDEVALYLAAPAQLPAPFESQSDDGMAWVVRPGMATAPERPTVSPYPALATIGTDVNGGFLLLDLEQIGSLNVVGDQETARGVLNALACEFATNPWSEQIHVTLVGMEDSFARDLDRIRIHQVEDVPALVRNLRADLEDRRSALDSYGVGGVLEARTQATEMESWAPHIVILAKTPEGHLRDELAELVARMPRLGIATISNGDALVAGATVEVTSRDQAEYRSGGAMPPLPFRPQVLAGEELELVQSLFATTTLASHPAVLEEEHPAPAAPEPVAADLADADGADEIPTVVSTEDAAEQATAQHETPEEAQPLEEAASASMNVPDWPAPYIRLLGPVDALNIADADAMPGRGVEFLAFLLLQNGGAPGALVQKNLWPDKLDPKNNNARQLAKQIRQALGHDPDGYPLLPEGRSNAGFTAHPMIRTDWHDFCDLIGPDLKTTSNENLVQAIKLVRGEPFAGTSRRRGWWGWRGPIEETMLAAIMDAADELAHRALQVGDHTQARFAARIAQATDPLNEAGWRLEIEAAMKAGDVDAFNRVVDEMIDRVGEDVELDEATQRLIDDAHAQMPGLS